MQHFRLLIKHIESNAKYIHYTHQYRFTECLYHQYFPYSVN